MRSPGVAVRLARRGLAAPSVHLREETPLLVPTSLTSHAGQTCPHNTQQVAAGGSGQVTAPNPRAHTGRRPHRGRGLKQVLAPCRAQGFWVDSVSLRPDKR